MKRPKLGQHFLRAERYADLAVDAAGLTPEDVVLEVGPGRGVLTKRLAERARVVAVELDDDLADGIARDFPQVDLVRGDAVHAPLPPFTACVSNLPYQISSPFLFRLLATPGWRVAVLLLQKEFADRLVAKAGSDEYGRLSVMAALGCDAAILTRVPPGAFDPPPRVDSALVKLTPRPPSFDVPPNFADVVERAFSMRRKKLSNSLGAKGAPHADRRPEELTPEELADVARHLRPR